MHTHECRRLAARSGGDMGFLQDHNASHATLHKLESGAGPHDTGTNDDDICRTVHLV
jgi:hypothetical protein